ncbi:MAG: prolipoprotein diacylglyceryl transferase [Nanoarchaeota archaeon]|nr:prolipoprotein diacylglyceryl transferase [Nanoarchaeota archaeon]
MFVNNINPTLLELGFLEIRYYGLVYVLGAIVGLLVLQYYRKKGRLELSKDEVWDLVFWLMVGLVVGARVFEVVFFAPGYFFQNPLEILKVWKGGMSFHGGFVGLVMAGYLYCRKKKLNFWKVADIVAIPAIIVAGIGRLANFTNSEFYGSATNLPWCVVFKKIDEVCRHPYQIYAALQRWAVGGVLALIYRKERKPGFIFWLMVLLEGVGRILVDIVRVESKYLYLSMGQWLSVVMVVVAVVILLRWYKKDLKSIVYFK